MTFFEKLFGTHSERELKLLDKTIDKIEGLRDTMVSMSDEELRAKTQEFKDRLANGETLDDILVEAFAVVREAGRRVLDKELYRVQLQGGVILHQGRIAEMNTGEGKANPIAMMLSAIMMLRYIGENEEADKFDAAILKVLNDGKILTRDLGGSSSTMEVAEAIKNNL